MQKNDVRGMRKMKMQNWMRKYFSMGLHEGVSEMRSDQIDQVIKSIHLKENKKSKDAKSKDAMMKSLFKKQILRIVGISMGLFLGLSSIVYARPLIRQDSQTQRDFNTFVDAMMRNVNKMGPINDSQYSPKTHELEELLRKKMILVNQAYQLKQQSEDLKKRADRELARRGASFTVKKFADSFDSNEKPFKNDVLNQIDHDKIYYKDKGKLEDGQRVEEVKLGLFHLPRSENRHEVEKIFKEHLRSQNLIQAQLELKREDVARASDEIKELLKGGFKDDDLKAVMQNLIPDYGRTLNLNPELIKKYQRRSEGEGEAVNAAQNAAAQCITEPSVPASQQAMQLAASVSGIDLATVAGGGQSSSQVSLQEQASRCLQVSGVVSVDSLIQCLQQLSQALNPRVPADPQLAVSSGRYGTPPPPPPLFGKSDDGDGDIRSVVDDEPLNLKGSDRHLSSSVKSLQAGRALLKPASSMTREERLQLMTRERKLKFLQSKAASESVGTGHGLDPSATYVPPGLPVRTLARDSSSASGSGGHDELKPSSGGNQPLLRKDKSSSSSMSGLGKRVWASLRNLRGTTGNSRRYSKLKDEDEQLTKKVELPSSSKKQEVVIQISAGGSKQEAKARSASAAQSVGSRFRFSLFGSPSGYSPLSDVGSGARGGAIELQPTPRPTTVDSRRVPSLSAAAAGAGAEMPRTLTLSPEETVDISHCPDKRVSHAGKTYGQEDFVTIGDLHGNSGKLIFFLIKEGLASFKSPDDCKKILDFYKSDRATEFPLGDEIKGLLDSINIKGPPYAPNVRLLGDELSDRGKNDGITIELLKKLSAAQPNFEIMMSNHSIEFLREMSGLDNDLDSGGQTDSSHPIKGVMGKKDKTEADVKAMQDVNAFIRETYLKHLKLVSVTRQSDGRPVVFTHAPTEPKIVYEAAKALGVAIGECDTQEKIEKNIIVCSGRINQEYTRKVREAVAKPSAAGNILESNMSSDAGPGVSHDPIADIFWKRHTSSWARDVGNWKTANGHDKGVGSTFELDNILGKGSGSDTGAYQVLRPTP